MKRFCFKVSIFILLVATCLVSICFLPANPNRYNAEFPVKRKTLKDNKNNQKLVFIGGSNLAFGLDSASLAKSMNCIVLNNALHAGIGMSVISTASFDCLQKGDCAIIAFEYEHFCGSAWGSDTTLDCISFNPELIPMAHVRTKIELIKKIPEYSGFRMSSFRVFVQNIICSKDSGLIDVYSTNSFNEFGDVVGHWNKANRKIFKPQMLNKIDMQSILFFKECIQKLRERGVTVLLFPPVVQEAYYKQNKDQIYAIVHELEKNGLSYFVPVERYVFPDNMFYDTTYHLNKIGVDKRTEMILDDILLSVPKLKREGIISD